MTIKGVCLPGRTGYFNVSVEGSNIKKVWRCKDVEVSSLSDEPLMVFPGLINMHDHLAMNYFSPYRSGVYRNYLDWTVDLQTSNKEIIAEFKRTNERKNIAIGEFKNLTAGFTTVCDHESNAGDTLVIDNYKAYNFIHSVRYHKRWRLKLNLIWNKKPWIVHLNEGYGDRIENEVETIRSWNFFNKRIIAVHGISMLEKDLSAVSGLVWCPASNLFLYDKTVGVNLLKKLGKLVVFGTDSSLTGDFNLWNHIRTAADLLESTEDVYHMMTTHPASMFPDLKRKAAVEKGAEADLVIARMKTNGDFWKSFYELNQEDILMVMKNGRVIKKDHEIKLQSENLIAVNYRGISTLVDRKLAERINDQQ